MTDSDPKIIMSPLCREFTEDGITASVEIYRLEKSEGWSLELVDADRNSTVWNELFATDQAAWDEFQREVREVGLLTPLMGDNRPRSIELVHPCEGRGAASEEQVVRVKGTGWIP